MGERSGLGNIGANAGAAATTVGSAGVLGLGAVGTVLAGLGAAGLAAVVAGVLVVAGIVVAIIVPIVVVTTTNTATTTAATNSGNSFPSGRTSAEITIPNQGSFTKAGRDINSIVCLGGIRYDFTGFNNQVRNYLTGDEIIGPYVQNVNSSYICVKNRLIQWNLKFFVISEKYRISPEIIFARVQEFQKKTFIAPSGLIFVMNFNAEIFIRGTWRDDTGYLEIDSNCKLNPNLQSLGLNLCNNSALNATKIPYTAPILKLGRTQMKLVVDDFGRFEILNRSYSSVCDGNLFTQSTSQMKNNLVNDKVVGLYLTDVLLFVECTDNIAKVKIDFNIISYDYYITAENIIKSLLSVSNQKISLPNEFVFKLNMKFNIIWFGSWFNENDDEIRSDPNGCITNLADAFSIKYEEDSCFTIIKKDFETEPEIMLETTDLETTIADGEETELRTNENVAKDIFDHSKWVPTDEFFDNHNPKELKYEFEEIKDDSNKVLSSF